MSENFPEDLLLMGKVIRPHGLEGLLRIISYAQSEESFLNAGPIFLRANSGETHEDVVLSLKPHKNIYLMRLKGLNSLEEAERYRGASILVKKASLSHKNDEGYFWYELLGLRVYLKKGRCIGRIKHILATGGNDIYVVRDGEKEVLIPAIHDVVEEIDLANRKIIISEMEGLLDLNEV